MPATPLLDAETTLSAPELAELQANAEWLAIVNDAVDGTYDVQVIATGGGDFEIEANSADASGVATLLEQTGPILAGQRLRFTFELGGPPWLLLTAQLSADAKTVRLGWPTSFTHCRLDTKPAMDDTESWQPAPGQPSLEGGVFIQDVPVSAARAFFRLRCP